MKIIRKTWQVMVYVERVAFASGCEIKPED